MKMEINFTHFEQEFRNYNRTDNFSREGLQLLFEHLEEEDTGEIYTLDVICLCCDYTEAEYHEHLENYGLSTLEQLQDRTTVLIGKEGFGSQKADLVHVVVANF